MTTLVENVRAFADSGSTLVELDGSASSSPFLPSTPNSSIIGLPGDREDFYAHSMTSSASNFSLGRQGGGDDSDANQESGGDVERVGLGTAIQRAWVSYCPCF